MKSAYIDGYQIHSSTYNPNGVYLNDPIPGLGSPKLRYSGTDRVGRSGHLPINQLYGERLLPWSGFIVAETVSAFNRIRRELAEVLAISNDVYGDAVPKLLTFTMDDDRAYQVEVLLNREPDLPTEYMMKSPVFMPLLAPDPQLYAQGQVTSSAITRPIGGGFLVPVTMPAVSTGGSGGSIVITNNGTMDTWPVVTLSGKHTNPYIHNATVGRTFQLTYETDPVDEIVIDMQNGTITLNGRSSLINAPTDDSDFFWLAKGPNAITFSSGDTADTGTMQMTYYHAYAGV